MRFWQKTLMVVLVLFIVALDLSVIMVMKKSWELNMERETQRASSEQMLIANNIYENLNSIRSRGAAYNEPILNNIMRSYAEFYQQQGITLELWDKDQLIFSDEDEDERETHSIHILNSLPAPYDHLQLLYKRDIEELYTKQSELNRFFALINFIVGPSLVILLYIFIRQLTKPLRQLSQTTKNIAEGNYSERVLMNRKDEFGELAQNFNRMAEAVERHVTELSEMAEEKQRIVDNLAHELRTPLTSMQGFAEYLNSAYIDEEERMMASSYILSETMRLKNLAFKLLDLSIIRHKPIDLKQVDVGELFKFVKQTELKNIEDSRIQLVLHSTIKSVWGDFDLLAAFLVNCIENSIHASGMGSEIRMLAYEQDSATVLEILDFGSGMTIQQAQRAFEPFYRADKVRLREHGGAGLGLSLCRQIAEAHEAQLLLESEPNKGTKIRIFLQLYNNNVLTL